MNNVTYRVKYWRWVNPEYGEWVITGLMSFQSAIKVAESLSISHEQVTLYEDEQESAQ